MFSYKAQVDDAMDEDTVSLPHQQSFSSLKTDSDYIYQVHTPSIHMPLYDSQASKSFISKQRASLYSLTATKDPKSNDANPYNSQVTLYRSTSAVRSLGRRLSAEKGTSEFTNYPLIKSDSQKSSPDLRFSGPSWKAVSVAHIKYGGPSSVSNLLLSTETASNFLYKPKANDSNVNLFSQTRKSSLESTLDKTSVDHMVERVPRECSSASADVTPAPALENTLQSILDSGTRDINTEDSQEYPLEKQASDTDALVKGSAAGVHSSHLMITRRHDAKFPEVRSDDISPDVSAEISNVTQRLLPRSTSFCTVDAYRKNDSKGQKSGGLNDYLLSVTSPKFQKHYGKNETRRDPESSRDHPDSYAQTESL